MEKSSLTALARQQLKIAQQASNGRSAKTVYGGHEHVLGRLSRVSWNLRWRSPA